MKLKKEKRKPHTQAQYTSLFIHIYLSEERSKNISLKLGPLKVNHVLASGTQTREHTFWLQFCL